MNNVGPVERMLRIVLGSALTWWAVSLFLSVDVVPWRLLDIALIALGLDFVVTGIRGYCPLYKWLGWSTAGRKVHG